MTLVLLLSLNQDASTSVQDANQHTEMRYLSLLLVCKVGCLAFNDSQHTSQKLKGSFIQNSNEEITLKQMVGHLYKDLFTHVPVLVTESQNSRGWKGPLWVI